MSIGFGLAIGILSFLLCGLGGPGIFGGIVSLLFVTLVTYLDQPVFAFGFAGVWVIAIAGLLLGSGIAFLVSGGEDNAKRLGGVAAGGVLAVLLAVVSTLTTWSLFHADAYRSLLGDVPAVEFEAAIQRLDVSGRPVASDAAVIDQTDVRLVDETLAQTTAQNLLGNDTQLGGTYHLGEMQLTRRQGHLVWAAPLEFASWSRWRSVGTSPGYVWVDAHSYKSAGLVTQIAGKPIAMECLESAYFGSNLERAVWSGGNETVGLTDFSFELDAADRPMFVATVYDNKVGFAGADPTGVVTFDPQTCRGERHTLADIPAWVNRVIPADMLLQQVADYGEYVHGYGNAAWGSHADILQPSPGIELVSTTRGGATAWYLGLSSPSNPNGTTGFLLVDSRTKKAVRFQQAGSTEDAARAAILGKVSNMRGWSSTLPILYNINGLPTYLSVIKDQSGNFKEVALTPVADRNIVVVADDLRRGLEIYQQAMAAQASASNGLAGGAPSVSIDGKVVRFSSEVIDGNTVYYLIVDSRPGVVMTATNGIGPQVALTLRGDAVHVHATGNAGSGSLAVQSLVNDAVTPAAPVPASAPGSVLPLAVPGGG